MVQFKTHLDEPKWSTLDYRVKWLVELTDLWMMHHGIPVTLITDIDTPKIHMEGSAHYDHRAVDISIIHVGMEKALEFATWVNKTFTYGGSKVCILTGPLDPAGKHNDHIHIQVPGPYMTVGRVKLGS